MRNLRDRIIAFAKSDKETPIISAIAAGLYPLLFYYYSNFSLLNSWEQFIFFVVYFLGVPILVFRLSAVLVKHISFLKRVQKFVLPILNLCWSAYLLVIITKGFDIKYIGVAVLLALVFAIVLLKYFKKIIVFQFLLAIMVAVPLFKYVFFEIESPDNWTKQPDNIKKVILKDKPNIYFIQPDGYANFSQIGKGYYNYDNSAFKNFLLEHDFKLYDDYRSNYYSTLSSNSSMFSMKHHYHNYPKTKIREVFNARNVIVGDNAVITILNNNNYKTHLLLDKSYMLINRAKLGFDYCNMNADSLSYFSRGFQMSGDIFSDLKALHKNAINEPSFYFLEELSPSHVTNKKSPGDIADIEREKYITRLEATNNWLIQVVSYLEEKDPNSLIIIAADHGGFVGMNTTLEARSKLSDRDLIYSIFTAQLAIKWPYGQAPTYDDKLKTPINLFRILFSYLSNNEIYLENLQDDKSYLQIESGAPFGVYEYINEEGEVVFNKVSKN
jgi:hypothetical protein